jgi:hypothetical protein
MPTACRPGGKKRKEDDVVSTSATVIDLTVDENEKKRKGVSAAANIEGDHPPQEKTETSGVSQYAASAAAARNNNNDDDEEDDSSTLRQLLHRLEQEHISKYGKNSGTNSRPNRQFVRHLLEASAGNVGLAAALYWQDYDTSAAAAAAVAASSSAPARKRSHEETTSSGAVAAAKKPAAKKPAKKKMARLKRDLSDDTGDEGDNNGDASNPYPRKPTVNSYATPTLNPDLNSRGKASKPARKSAESGSKLNSMRQFQQELGDKISSLQELSSFSDANNNSSNNDMKMDEMMTEVAAASSARAPASSAQVGMNNAAPAAGGSGDNPDDDGDSDDDSDSTCGGGGGDPRVVDEPSPARVRMIMRCPRTGCRLPPETIIMEDNDEIFVYLGGDQRVPLNVKYAVIDPSVTTVRSRAFMNREQLVSVVFHDGVEIVEYEAFSNCSSLPRIKLLGVREIRNEAFDDCVALSGVEFGGKLETIGYSAFWCCRSLRSIKVPSVRTVQQGAFGHCEQLTDVEFGIDLERIGIYSFENCPNLQRIAIPLKDNLFPLDAQDHEYTQFNQCKNLTTVDIVGAEGLNMTITSLLRKSWENEMNEEIDRINQELPDTPTEIKTYMIQQWIRSVIDRMEHYKHGQGYEAEHSRLSKERDTEQKSKLLEENISTLKVQRKRWRVNESAREEKRIVPDADVNMASSVERKKMRICNGNEEAEEKEEVETDSPVDGNDNVFVYMGGDQVVPDEITHAIIDPSVKIVRSWAFKYRPHLVSVIFHDGVEIVEYEAFYGCTSLRGRIKLLGVREIGVRAFFCCFNFPGVEFGNKLVRIGVEAFRYCRSLRSVKIPSVKNVQRSAFENCRQLTDVEFGVKLERIGDHSFHKCPNLQRIAIPLKENLFPTDMYENRYNQFDGCRSLVTVDAVGVTGVHETQEINHINQTLPNTPADEKTEAICTWIRSVINRRVEIKRLRFVQIQQQQQRQQQQQLYCKFEGCKTIAISGFCSKHWMHGFSQLTAPRGQANNQGRIQKGNDQNDATVTEISDDEDEETNEQLPLAGQKRKADDSKHQPKSSTFNDAGGDGLEGMNEEIVENNGSNSNSQNGVPEQSLLGKVTNLKEDNEQGKLVKVLQKRVSEEGTLKDDREGASGVALMQRVEGVAGEATEDSDDHNECDLGGDDRDVQSAKDGDDAKSEEMTQKFEAEKSLIHSLTQASSKESNELKNQVVVTAAHNEAVMRKMIDDFTAERSDFESKLTKQQSTINELRDELKERQDELEEKDEKVTDMKRKEQISVDKLREANTEIAGTKARLEEAVTCNVSLTNQLEDLQDSKSKLEREKATNDALLRKWQNEVNEKSKIAERLSEDLNSKEAAMKKMSTEIAALNSKLAEHARGNDNAKILTEIGALKEALSKQEETSGIAMKKIEELEESAKTSPKRVQPPRRSRSSLETLDFEEPSRSSNCEENGKEMSEKEKMRADIDEAMKKKNIPNVSLDDIIGQEKAKRALSKLKPFRDPAYDCLYEDDRDDSNSNTGILLYGPPGTVS